MDTTILLYYCGCAFETLNPQSQDWVNFAPAGTLGCGIFGGPLCKLKFQSHHELLTVWNETKLCTGNFCICGIPGVMTHCPPLSLEAHLHSTLKIVSSSFQPNTSVVAYWNCRYAITRLHHTNYIMGKLSPKSTQQLWVIYIWTHNVHTTIHLVDRSLLHLPSDYSCVHQPHCVYNQKGLSHSLYSPHHPRR